MKTQYKVALVGNPNVGKTSLFNQLTKLNSAMGNFPGVTVEKLEGKCKVGGTLLSFVDLPGTFSIYPRTNDEKEVFTFLQEQISAKKLDAILYIFDASHFDRSLFYLTQITDLQIPTIVGINFHEELKAKNILLDLASFKKNICSSTFLINARTGAGIDTLKKEVVSIVENKAELPVFFLPDVKKEIKTTDTEKVPLFLKKGILNWAKEYSENIGLPEYENAVAKEIASRYRLVNTFKKKIFQQNSYSSVNTFSQKVSDTIDAVTLNPIIGMPLFFVLMFFIFQTVFYVTGLEFVDVFFTKLSVGLSEVLPNNWIGDILTKGLLPSIAAVVIFIPQIALLFIFISLLEQTGYMSRIIFMVDRGVSKFGLNGRSVISYLSGAACAVPAIMAARTIENSKERLITILTTPLITCSARLPVYTLLIAIAVPEKMVLGIFNLQGIVMMGLYFLGFFAALLFSYILKKTLKNDILSSLIETMPKYRLPSVKNTLHYTRMKVKIFIFDAGKIILVMSMILWVLLSFGPSGYIGSNDTYSVEESFLGKTGIAIEPVIKPLGYNWEIGIALISSFAAREVFISSLATIYSVGEGNNDASIMEKLKHQKNPQTGKDVFSFATSISLLLFYAFALQCMSTLAIIRRETGGWKWAGISFFVFGGIAYLSAFIAYQVLS